MSELHSGTGGRPQVRLRPYQAEAVHRVREAYRNGARAPLLVMPTGSGKTVVFGHIAAATEARGNRVLILVHRRELVRQASEKLAAAGVPHGIIAAGHEAAQHPVQVASVQTLARRLDDPRYAAPDLLVVIDEAHHAVAGQWAAILAAFPRARLLGVTATPERADGRGLGKEAGGPFDAMVVGPSVADLIRDGYLVPARVLAPADGGPDLSGVPTVRGDYDATALATAMDRPGIVGDAVAHYAQHAPGLPAIAFCVSIEHAKRTAEQFRAAGWRAVAASGAMPTAERDAAVTGLSDGSVQVLCVCDLVSEGLDVPSIGAVILLRPTQSLGLYLQQVGRGLRPAPGKKRLTVLDHAGGALRHGLPDAPRAWSLEGHAARQRRTAAVRRCPACGVVHASAGACPACGRAFAAARPNARGRDLAEREGVLREMDATRLERLRCTPLRRLLRAAETWDDVEAIRRARGYRPGWTWHAWRDLRAERAAA